MAELTFAQAVGVEACGGAIVACLVIWYENYRRGVEREHRHSEAKSLIRVELRRHIDLAAQLLKAGADELLALGPFQTEVLRILPTWGGFDSSPASDRLIALGHHIARAEETNALRRAIEAARLRAGGSDRTYEEELELANTRKARLNDLADQVQTSAAALVSSFS